jgi:hypothetical protein
MPISPENRARYPKDWKEIRRRILERAGDRCEGSPRYPDCRAPNGSIIKRRVDCEYGEVTIERSVVLTIAHLDHTPENCADDNLRAWCQRCHLTYDAKHHALNAAKTRRRKLKNGELFDG